jgi:hypothetical protein
MDTVPTKSFHIIFSDNIYADNTGVVPTSDVGLDIILAYQFAN